MGSQWSLLGTKDNNEAIVNFQRTALLVKLHSLNSLTLNSPTQIFTRLNLPVIARTKRSLTINQFHLSFVYNISNLLDFYDIYFKIELAKYKPWFIGMDLSETKEIYSNNARVITYEILERILQQSTFNAIVEDGYFSCPFYHQNCCPNSDKLCAKFVDIRNVITKCKKRIMYNNHKKEYLPNGDGNIEDCMFLCYLIGL